MHLESIKVNNFGVHESEEVNLQDGLVVVRGRNGSGKSTLAIQSSLYALFGSSTLSSTLADTVTRGEKESSLKVEVKYGPYVVKRSKASASVVGNGIKISGQAEVSKFFYELFGIQKGTESMVLVSEQGKTAGILDGKPGEVNSFIEDLAGFSQIDDLIERVKLEYPTGQKAVLEDRLEELKLRKKDLDLVEVPKVKPLERSLVKDEASKAKHLGKFDQVAEDIIKLNITIQENIKHNHAIANVEKDIVAMKAHSEDLRAKCSIVSNERKELPKFVSRELTEAEELIAELDEKNKEWAAFEWLNELQTEDEWDEGLESFNKELKETADDVLILGNIGVEILSKLSLKKSSIVTDSTCTLCGQDVEHLHKEINAGLKVDIGLLEVELAANIEELLEQKDLLKILNTINTEHLRRIKWANLDYLRLDTSVVPYTYSLIGDTPIKPDSKAVSAATALLSNHKAACTKLENYNNRYEELRREVTQLVKTDIPASEEKLKSLDVLVDITKQQEEMSFLEGRKTEINEQLAKIRKSILELKVSIEAAQAKILAQKEAQKVLGADIESTSALIVTDGRNGKIVKAVRDAKPLVLSMIWAKILYSVSVVFSDMVGYDAGVEKDAKGFRINGLPVSRLSGSEKSVLGIALRSTLRDIFAPGCGFMLWDECFADMDVERTAAATAAIQNVRGQNIIITHEDDSEMAADQCVEVGV